MNYFPVALAGGRAFCNRTNELKRLQYNFDNNIASLLVAPRRYGKTSLALQAITKAKLPYAHIDLYKALHEEDIARFILNGIGQLLGKIEPTPKKLIKLAGDFFGTFQLKFSLEKYGITVEFSKKGKKPVELILSALEKLDDYLSKHKKKAVLFLDEFQTIAVTMTNSSLEAAIREAVQKSKSLCYIFSGSYRHLIEAMFNDRKRPFYNSCDQISLKRIEEAAYKPYIQKAAIAKWSKEISEDCISTLFELAALHPYYINKLCSLVWQNDKLITMGMIEKIWENYIDENKSRVEQEISLLSLNQRKILLNLFNENTQEPFGKESVLAWSMPSTSIHTPLYPGLIVKDALIDSTELTVTEAASCFGVTRTALSRLLNAHAGISPEMAVRLAKFFNNSVESWINLQAQYDAWLIQQDTSHIHVKPFSALMPIAKKTDQHQHH
jgi:addiction module HigA family antidote